MSAGQSVPATAPARASVDLELRTRNLLLGALAGAIVMLLALPSSRPYYLNAIFPSRLDHALDKTAEYAQGAQLTDAKSLDNDALWFSVASDRIIHESNVTTQELETVESIVSQAALLEPENAFWTQADAALLDRMGQPEKAAKAWIEGSKRLHWSDHQNSYLARSLNGRAVPAYAFARLYYLRTDNAAHLILEGGRRLLSRFWDDPKLSMRLRAATILNGDLVRKNARSIAILREGVELTESPIAKPTGEPNPSEHHLLIARLKLAGEIEKAKLGYDAETIERIFLEAESATALTTTDDASEAMRNEAAQAAIAQVLPGSLLVCAALCIFVLAGQGAYRYMARLDAKRPWLGTVCAALFGGLIALFATSAYAALALSLCVFFSGSTPKNVRKRRPAWLGPLFSLTVSTVALCIVLAWAAGIVLYSAPGRTLLAPLLPPQFDGLAVAAGIVALAVGFLFLCAPLWAFAQRLPTFHIVDVGLRQLATKVVVVSLALAVITGPLCVYWNNQLTDQVRERFTNEPDRYYTNIKSHDTHPGP